MRRLKIFKIYAIFWLFIFFIVFSSFSALVEFFFSTITFNVSVLTVLSIGLMVIFKAAYDLVMITGTFSVIRYKKGEELEYYINGIDRVFPENVASMFQKRTAAESLYFTQQEIRDVSNWLEDKFFHQKVYVNFFIGTALLIGLLGTFTGLLGAIGEMGGIITSLRGDINIGEVMARFAGPIAGMSMGFGSSLFGVAAALILSIKGYILNRNQEMLIEDVQDWMNSIIVDSGGVNEEGMSTGGSTISGVMDVFTQKMGEFSHNMEKSNRSNEAIVRMLTESIDNEAKSAQAQINALDSISMALKDLNVNQYQNATTLNDSLQDLSASMMQTNRSIKALLELQQSSNKLLQEFLENKNNDKKGDE